MKYRVKKQFAGNDEMVTTVGGKVVSLIKPHQRVTPASDNGPAKTISIPLATQQELAQLFKDGNPVIETYEESTDAEKK